MDEPKMYQRTASDVRSIIGYAKLDENKLTHITQVLDYSSSHNKYESYKLLQLDAHLLQQLNEGQELSFKGGRTEEAVLCTDNQTYEVREAETSNSLLIVPNLLWPKESNLNESLDKSCEEDEFNASSFSTDILVSQNQPPRAIQNQSVLKIIHTYYEVQQIKPKFRKLNELLQLTRYSGPEHEYAVDKRFLFTYTQLLNTIQASRCELQKGFTEVHAMEIDGYFRVLDLEYEFRVISYMLGIIEENSWDFQTVSRNITIDSLKEVIPQCILHGLFDIYTTPNDEDQYTYKEDMISRLFAQTILKNASKFSLEDFLTTWQASMPEGMKTEKSHLKGIALIDNDANPPCIKALDNFTLPAVLLERFKALFKIKKMWTLDEIAPYIEGFTTPSLSLTTLISKYSRASTVNGVRMYGAKHSS